ncbi:uncharacterized protein LOC127877212 [Dreissena polymorpha]|nr:uncharacterized protein LOC127877212 [Dreissena polymorpha]
MLPFVVVLCFVAGGFGQKLPPITVPTPSTRPTPPPPPPGNLTDDEGNVYNVKVTRAGMNLYNSTGSLLSTILNQDGWLIVRDPISGDCVIGVPDVEGDNACYVESAYSGVVPANTLCKGKIVQHVKVPCEVEEPQEPEEPKELSKRQIWPAPIWHRRPRWSRCCRWRRVAWWPCSRSVCLAYNNLRRCVSWGCGLWGWRWRWVRICVEGYERPWWGWWG